MSVEMISSRQNSLVKQLKKLGESKRARAEAGQVLAEGIHLVRTQIEAGVYPELLVVAQRVADHAEIQLLRACCDDARWVILANDIFDQIAPTDSPAGVLSLSALPNNDASANTLLDTLVLDNVQDPGNVGSLIRTAVAAGVKQIVLSEGCADAWSPRCLRAGQGAQWLARIYKDQDLLIWLNQYQGAIAATVLDDAQSLYALKLDEPTAWLFGNEGQGVRQELVACATQRVTIPMPGGMESLNVNAAAAVCLFEQVRQRLNA